MAVFTMKGRLSDCLRSSASPQLTVSQTPHSHHPRLVSAFAYFIPLPKLSVSLQSHDPLPSHHPP